MQLKRDGADGTHIGGNVFAGRTVTAGGGAGHHPVFVQNADGQAIQFQLAAPAQGIGLLQTVLDAFVEGEEAPFIKDVIQRQHGHFMAHLAEKGQWRGADTLGR